MSDPGYSASAFIVRWVLLPTLGGCVYEVVSLSIWAVLVTRYVVRATHCFSVVQLGARGFRLQCAISS